MSETIAIIGGTGALGTGLARRWSQAGHHIIIASRDPQKAQAACEELSAYVGDADHGTIEGDGYDGATQRADIVVLTVPYSHHQSTVTQLKPALTGKLLIDVTVPLRPPKVGTVQLPALGSAGAEAAELLGDDVDVVSAFQNVAAHHLKEGGEVDCDVLVCGNNKDARERVIGLIQDMGMRGFHAGPIANSAAAEALTSVIININRAHKCHAGIRISGLPDA